MASKDAPAQPGKAPSSLEVEQGWIATPSSPQGQISQPAGAATGANFSLWPYSTSPASSSYAQNPAPLHNPFTSPSHPQYQAHVIPAPRAAYPAPQGPITFVQPQYQPHIHVGPAHGFVVAPNSSLSAQASSPGASYALPPSHGLAMAYQQSRHQPAPSSSLRSSQPSAPASHSGVNDSYYAPPPYSSVAGNNKQQRVQDSGNYPGHYSGNYQIHPNGPGMHLSASRSASLSPELVGKQQFLHKSVSPSIYVYPNAYQQNFGFGAVLPIAAPVSSSPSLHDSRIAFPQFSGDTKVQIGSSHLMASRSQDEYMRQIKALQNFYGYNSPTSNNNQTPSNANNAANGSDQNRQNATMAKGNANNNNEAGLSSSTQSDDYAVPIHQLLSKPSQSSNMQEFATAGASAHRSSNLTASVDVMITGSETKEAFIEEQERILRECNERMEKERTEKLEKERVERQAKESKIEKLPERPSQGDYLDDEAIFDELLRSENPNADVVSFPVHVVPDLVEELDEKLQQRIVEAQATSRNARAYPSLDATLWNLSYRFKHLTTPNTEPQGKGMTGTRSSYLISSRGRREPLEESVGTDWQLLDDSGSSSSNNPSSKNGSGANNNNNNNMIFNDGYAPGFQGTGRFQYPSNIVTFEDAMAYSMRPAQVSKDSELEKAIFQDVVDLAQLQSFCLGYGVPKRVRAVVWQLLMGYAPQRATDRGKMLRTARIAYYEMFDEFLSERVALTKQDRSMYNLVLVDAPRTHPDGYHALFNKKCIQSSLERILYLWARSHPETSYFQGLNDLASIILVVFLECTLPNLADVSKPGQQDLLDHLDLPSFESSFLASPQCDEALQSALYCVEADAYHCLCILLDSIKRYHVFSPGGVYSESMIVHFEEIIKRADPELHKHLQDSDLLFIQFAFRWMLCLFTRELETKNLVCLWDSYIIENLGFPLFHIYVCAAYLIELRSQLLGNDMITMMGFLQRAPTGHFTKHDVHRLVQNASEIFSRYPLDLKPISNYKKQ